MRRALSCLLVVVFIVTAAPAAALAAETQYLVFVAPADGTCSLAEQGKTDPVATLDGRAGELLTVSAQAALSVRGQNWTATAPLTSSSAAWTVVTFALPCAADSVSVTAGNAGSASLKFSSQQSRGTVVSIAYPSAAGGETTLAFDCARNGADAGYGSLSLTGLTNDRASVASDVTLYKDSSKKPFRFLSRSLTPGGTRTGGPKGAKRRAARAGRPKTCARRFFWDLCRATSPATGKSRLRALNSAASS